VTIQIQPDIDMPRRDGAKHNAALVVILGETQTAKMIRPARPVFQAVYGEIFLIERRKYRPVIT
ncbi:hypothetical protein PSYMO_39790, partial [Pseudomonas amygdali pv. mori str. 301020]